jgi:hypothetical protein
MASNSGQYLGTARATTKLNNHCVAAEIIDRKTALGISDA